MALIEIMVKQCANKALHSSSSDLQQSLIICRCSHKNEYLEMLSKSAFCVPSVSGVADWTACETERLLRK
jgi:hypothetical protein